MWPVEHPVGATLAAAALVGALALATYWLIVRMFPDHSRAGEVVTGVVTIGVAIVLSTSLDHAWDAKRARDAQVASSRLRHLQRLQALLREESDALKSIAQALRDARYFALVANDARKAIWQDQTLTADVERHFPEYYREREHLIAAIVEHDGELARARQVVSAALHLTPAEDAYRTDLVHALVRKCGGTASSPDRMIDTAEAIREYDKYRCDPEASRVCRMVFDRADDLADAALLASEAAGRYAEETVLHGSCTYAPDE
jgi:hypothetical protein